MQIEDEVEFLISNLEFIVEPDAALSQYFYHRIILFVLIMFNLFFEMGICVYTYRNSELIVTNLNTIYRGWSLSELSDFVMLTTYLNTVFNIIQYSFGFYAIFTHRVTNYQIFNILMLLSIFARVLLTYINILNILMVVLKCFTYVYSRFVLTLLFRVLILPNPQQIPPFQGEGI